MILRQNRVFAFGRSVIRKLLTLQATRAGLLALIFILDGCATTDVAGDGSSASVLISGHPEEEIRDTTIQVFGWNNYRRVNEYNRVNELNFEKVGSRWDMVTYGSMSAKPVWIKMATTITPQADGYLVLSCDVYVIEDHGDKFLQTERRITVGKCDECKKILDQIKQRISLVQSQAH
jgi:hypothetical protein